MHLCDPTARPCGSAQTVTGRIRELAERYGETFPQITDEVGALAARVEEHLKRMGAPAAVEQGWNKRSGSTNHPPTNRTMSD